MLAKSAVVRRLRGLAAEGGQAIVLVVVSLVVLLGMAALVVDLGYAYYTHRSLQASADVAALAGAQELPDGARAELIARDYTAAAGGKNSRPDIDGVTTTITTKCIASIPGCDPVNAVVVVEKAPTKTFFAGVLGINAFNVKATSTACSPCGTRPLDIMMVLDRTGSMCQDHWGNWDTACTDLENARAGMKTFLEFLDPTTQWVGLATLPPSAPDRSSRCTAAGYTSTAYKSTHAYVVVPLSSNYSNKGQLVGTSDLVSTINCQKGGGYTAYALALEKAQRELEVNGRPDVKDVIVFLSDGAANTGPSDYAVPGPLAAHRKRPCWQGVQSAAAIKAKGTLIYSIGYDLNALDGGANECKSMSFDGPDESPAITAYQAIQQIASPGAASQPCYPTCGFYDKPSPGQLKTIFTDIAVDLQKGSAALIDNDRS